jgi:hypothetical protein
VSGRAELISISLPKPSEIKIVSLPTGSELWQPVLFKIHLYLVTASSDHIAIAIDCNNSRTSPAACNFLCTFQAPGSITR